MKRDRVLALLGLAMKAGKLASGEFAVEKETKSGKSELVIVAEDASENTKKQVRNMCQYYRVKFAVYATKEQLGAAIGKEYRASIAVLDPGFSKSIAEHLDGLER